MSADITDLKYNTFKIWKQSEAKCKINNVSPIIQIRFLNNDLNISLMDIYNFCVPLSTILILRILMYKVNLKKACLKSKMP